MYPGDDQQGLRGPSGAQDELLHTSPGSGPDLLIFDRFWVFVCRHFASVKVVFKIDDTPISN